MRESLLSIEKECNALLEDIDRFNNKVIDFISANEKGVFVEAKDLRVGDKVYLNHDFIDGIGYGFELWHGETTEIKNISFSDADIYSGRYFLIEFDNNTKRRVNRKEKLRKA